MLWVFLKLNYISMEYVWGLFCWLDKSLLIFYLFTVDSAHIDKTAKIPEEVMGGLKELGLFGLLIPEEYGKTFFYYQFS